jgi:hypothetical protein
MRLVLDGIVAMVLALCLTACLHWGSGGNIGNDIVVLMVVYYGTLNGMRGIKR